MGTERNWYDQDFIDGDNYPTSGTGSHEEMALRILASSKVYTGSGSPSGVVTPEAIGDVYIDTTNAYAYVATTALDSGWKRTDNLLTPEYTYVDYTTGLSNPSYAEGRVFYDHGKKAVSYYNNEVDVTVNMGQEVLIRVYNDSGSDIANGKIVYPAGVDVASGQVTIGIADASVKDKCRLVGMATHTIENGTSGYVTRLGEVGGLNTAGFSGILYLETDGSGDWTMTKPDDGGYITVIGAVGKQDASDGTIVVDPSVSDLTVEVTDTNGFPSSERTGTTLSFDDGLLRFSITPTGSGFHYYQLGDKFEKTGAQTVDITDVTGLHFIYFDGDTLTAIANPSEGVVSDIVRNKCLVAYVYWNATDAAQYVINDERHGISMSPETHVYLHFTQGAKYLSGLALGDIVISTGALDSNAQFSNTAGFITDEDLLGSLDAVASTTGLEYFYRSGSTGAWIKATNSGFSFPVGATPLPQYNEYTGATYQLTEVTSGNYMLIHVFANNDTLEKPVVFVGSEEYSTITGATAGITNEINSVLGNLPGPEYVPIATVMLEGKTSFGNSVQTRIVQNGDGEDYRDWRTSEVATGNPATSHNNLAGLQLSGTGTIWGHVDDQAQSLYGVKTFNSFPITPSSAPTTDYQVANKKYVDDNSGGTTYTYTRTETAGEAVVAGNVCYAKSDGKYWKADASAESTGSTDLLIATASISADATGLFGEPGYKWTTSGLTQGNQYLSETAGAFTATAPTTSAAVIRLIGTALTTTVLIFRPAIGYGVLT